jgi:hypothetical protein
MRGLETLTIVDRLLQAANHGQKLNDLGSNKYVVIRYLLAQNIVVMMDKIPNSTNMVF